MVGFITASGTKYYINQNAGYFFTNKDSTPIRYTYLSAIIGNNAYFKLLNGQILRTNIVVAYI